MSTDTNSAPADLQTYVNDQHGLLRHIQEAIARQIEDERLKKHAEAAGIVQRLHAFYQRRAQETESHVNRIGSTVTAKAKEAVTSALGVAAGLYDKVRKDPVSRMLRDDYVASHMASISFTMLQTTALAFGDQALANLCDSALKDLNPLIVDLTHVIPAVVAIELKEDNTGVDPSAADKAVETVRQAWRE